MPDISTLVQDIYGLFGKEYIPLEEAVAEFSSNLSKKIQGRLSEERAGTRLRLSNIGSPCKRQLWYKVNQSDKEEPLGPETRMKFLYGDILEEMLLWMAKEAGHKVEAEQENVSLSGVGGHIDAIVDGVVLDVKSASSYSFKKFTEHLNPATDSFGYLGQLRSYVTSLHNDPRVTRKNAGGFFVIDKTLGKLHLDIHEFGPWDYEVEIADTKEKLASPTPPRRGFEPEPEGKSGNMKLPVNCSYCSFKKECYPRLRAFAYSSGPVFLTRVEKEPNVREITE